jgi:hypothetical protein
MINLKQLYTIIEDIFINHPEVNSVTRLSVKDYMGDRSKVYTNANIHYVNGSVQNKYINHNFLITLADRLNPTGSNELEILNSTQLIAEDLFTVLGKSYDFTFQKNVTIQTFTEADGDRVAGIYFQVNIQVLRSQNICILPTKDAVLLPADFPIPFL